MTILTSQPDFVRADLGSWQHQMKTAIRSADELRKRLSLPVESHLRRDFSEAQQNASDSDATSIAAVENFPVFVPLSFLARIRPGDPNDPLLRQVLPLAAEDEKPVGYSVDPLGEFAATLTPGVLQKYRGRVLLVTTGACAINCRYCFRRHFPYEESPSSLDQWQDAIDQIEQDDSIQEVILSGGDPLTLVDESLSRLIDRLDQVSHLKRLRIHTRLPIVIPDRVTNRLLNVLNESRLQTVMVVHCNHANEIDEPVEKALSAITSAGVMLLNQSVLLRQVNDDEASLIELSRRLLDCGVLPYYLHKNDPVVGTSHFEVSIERGVELIKAMRTELPGFAVPRFVQEIAGEPNKTVLA